MKSIIVSAALLALVGCTQVQHTVSNVCADIAKIPAPAVIVLDQQDPHSSVGVIWADVKAACANGAPTPGVALDWVGLVFGELKALAPTVLPVLIGLL